MRHHDKSCPSRYSCRDDCTCGTGVIKSTAKPYQREYKPTETEWHGYDRLVDKMERYAQEAGRTWTDTADLTEKERRFYRRMYQHCIAKWGIDERLY